MDALYTLSGTLEADYNDGTWQGVFDAVVAIALWSALTIDAANPDQLRYVARSSYDLIHWSAEYSDCLPPRGRYIEFVLYLAGRGTVTPEISAMSLDWLPAVVGESNADLAMSAHNVRLEVAPSETIIRP
jgi:hypothetical protein